MTSRSILLCAALVTACGTDPEPAPPPVEARQEAPKVFTASVEPLPDQLPVEDLPELDEPTLVPPPGELQLTLKKAGIDTALATLVPERSFDLSGGADRERTAVRTGVLIADVLLTVAHSDDARLVQQLEQIRGGLKALKADAAIDRTLADLTDRVKAGAVRRDALVRELDELAHVAIPQAGFAPASHTLPMIEAGSWLSGTHLVAKAALQSGNASAADSLLKQPAVVRYFQLVTAAEQAEGTVPSMVASSLQDTLSRLLVVADRDTPLTDDDLRAVIDATGDVLEML